MRMTADNSFYRSCCFFGIGNDHSQIEEIHEQNHKQGKADKRNGQELDGKE
jgi:hypothetical protein